MCLAAGGGNSQPHFQPRGAENTVFYHISPNPTCADQVFCSTAHGFEQFSPIAFYFGLFPEGGRSFARVRPPQHESPCANDSVRGAQAAVSLMLVGLVKLTQAPGIQASDREPLISRKC